VKATLACSLRLAGQMCTSTSRVFVHRSLVHDFCAAIQHGAEQLKIDRTDLATQDRLAGAELLPGHGSPHMGPLYAGEAVDRFLRFQTMARREARKSIVTGKKIPDFRRGNFVTPGIHLMKQFDATSSYQSNVVFAPDIAIYEDTIR
jgi:acyl-CoA reductase-like NAD-dependent aldehyde dehydrogenase